MESDVKAAAVDVIWPRQRSADGVLEVTLQQYFELRDAMDVLYNGHPMVGPVWKWLVDNGYDPRSFMFKPTAIKVRYV
jgi:hypothetical protein